MTPPCLNCPRRCVGCHGTCEEYKRFSEAVENARQERHLAVEAIVCRNRSRSKTCKYKGIGPWKRPGHR